MAFISLDNIEEYKPAPNPPPHISNTPSLLPNTAFSASLLDTANPPSNHSNQFEAVVATTTTNGFVTLSADTQVKASSTALRNDHPPWHIKEPTLNASKINFYQTQFMQENSASETQVFQDSSTIDVLSTLTADLGADFWSNAANFSPDSGIDLIYPTWCENEQLPDENQSQIVPSEQNGPPLTSAAIQSQYYSHHYPIKSSNNQIGEYDLDGNIRCISIGPEIQSPSNPLNRTCRENGETASELSANSSLTSEKQENSSLLTIPILSPLRRHHPESPHLQNSQECSRSRTSNFEVHEHSSLRPSQSQEKKRPQAQQQCERVKEIVCSPEYNNSEPGQRRGSKKRRRLDANQENSINDHKVQGEKQQQEENDYDELGGESQEELTDTSEDENQSDDPSYTVSVGGSPSAVPKRKRRATSNYSSSISEHDPELASYSLDPSIHNTATSVTAPLQSENIPIRGFLTLETFDSEVVYCLRFSQDVLPAAKERQRQDTASNTRDREGLKSCELGKSLTKEQESRLAKLVKANKSWPEIKRCFPGYPLQFLKNNYFIEQKGEPRKRGAKLGSKRRRKYGVSIG